MYVQNITTLEKHTAEIIHVQFSPDGQTLISTDGKVIYFWGVDAAGNWTHQQTWHVRALFPRFSPDGSVLVFRDGDDCLQVWSRNGQQITTLTSAWQGKMDGVFSPDGKCFVTGNLRGQLQLWDMQTFHFQTIPAPIPMDERIIIPGERDATRTLWSRCFSFTPDGKTIVFKSPSKQGWVHICALDLQSFRISKMRTLPYSTVNDVEVSPDGCVVAIADYRKNCIDVYETNLFEQIVSLPMEESPGFLVFSPDGHFLASDREDGIVCIWSMQTFQLITSFAAHPDLWVEQAEAIGGLVWSPQGDVIATGGASSFRHDISKDDYTVKLWQVHHSVPES